MYRPSPEDALLIAACRPDGAPPEPPHRDIDWQHLLPHAEALGLAPALHAHCARLGATVIPTDVTTRLAETYYAAGAQNAMRLDDLRELLVAFAGAGIGAIVLKGAAFTEALYGNLALRPMKDLDLLVRPSDLDRAEELVRGLGYEPDEWFRPAAWYRTSLHHLVPYRRGETVVEIHHRLLPPGAPPGPTLAAVWARAETRKLAQTDAMVLAPNDAFVHAALHVAVDRFAGRLRDLRDLAALAASDTLAPDWGRLAAITDPRTATHLYYVLRTARVLVQAAIPPDLERALATRARVRARDVPRVVRMTSRLALRGPEESFVLPTWLVIARLDAILTRRGWPSRSAALARTVYESAHERAHALGYGGWAPLYVFFVRPWSAVSAALRRSRRGRRRSSRDGTPAKKAGGEPSPPP